MELHISRQNFTSQFIEIQLKFKCETDEITQLQLPSWRAGRYELANYAQKIRRIHFYKGKQVIEPKKTTKDCWVFTAKGKGAYEVHYEYYANQMDAGGSWSDDLQLYLNFINFTFQIKGREEEKVRIVLDLPTEYQVATALTPVSKHQFEASGFQELVDSPLIASPTLQHFQYQCDVSRFHLWFQGEIHFDTGKLLEVFKKFTEKQIQAFGEFPAEDYHFLFQLLPYAHYHGVEHRYSTVITLGPSMKIGEKEAMDSLVGISSHELYHFWNVCRIRPKELLPYDFSKEAYIQTGVVAEGVTTYMGDLFLLESGYYSSEDFLQKISRLINREYESDGWQNQSIVESSFDLWLDGYKPGIPEKKVSIYNRGALISLYLDLLLREESSSLHKVMKKMWERFGKQNTGYTLDDYKNCIADCLKNKEKADRFFEAYIYGKEDLLPPLTRLLENAGVGLSVQKRENALESDFGIIADKEKNIQKIHPKSPAYQKLMTGDHIHKLAFLDNPHTLDLEISRFGKTHFIRLPFEGRLFYKRYTLHFINNQKEFILQASHNPE